MGELNKIDAENKEILKNFNENISKVTVTNPMGAGRPSGDLAKTQERRDYVWKYMKLRGVHNFPAEEVAKQWSVSIQTIYNDVDFNLNLMPMPTVEKEAKSLLLAFNRAIMTSFKIIETNIPQKVEMPIRLVNETDREYNYRVVKAEQTFHREREVALKRASDGVSKLIQAGQAYTQFLENFGFKEKIANKVEIKEVSLSRIEHVLKKAEHEGRRILVYEDAADEQG